jgi:Family of unknown function (DUF6152)
MKSRLAFRVGTIFLLILACFPAFAHHGVSAYDVTKQITLKGVVSSFEFINPHSEIRLDVADESGHTSNWLCEAGSLNFLFRRGWSRNSLKAGDRITVMGNASKNGSLNLRLTKVVLPDGTELDPLGGSQIIR